MTASRRARKFLLTALVFAVVGQWGLSFARQLPTPSGPASPIFLLQQGIGLYQQKKHEAARAKFSELIRLDPQNFTAHYYTALCSVGLEQPDEALKSLRTAVEVGLPNAETAFAADPELANASKNASFRAGLEQLIEELRDRARGVLRGRKFPLDPQTADGKPVFPNGTRGKVAAVLYVDPTIPASIAAGFYLESAAEPHGAQVASVLLVQVTGKSKSELSIALTEAQMTTGLSLPHAFCTDQMRQQLLPFREYPTLVVLDRDGLARRIVEGFPADLPDRYAAAVLDVVRGTDKEKAPVSPRAPDVPKPAPDKPVGG
ncbi:MAG: hypothetical protein ACKVX7_02655 [Planctomycetota bacterium]